MSDFLVHLEPFTVASVITGLFAYVVPIVLAAGWAALAFVALAEGQGGGQAIGWGLVVLLLPWLGAAAYLLSGRRGPGRVSRRMAVASGALVVLVVATHFMIARS
jgi:hypothetical protein